ILVEPRTIPSSDAARQLREIFGHHVEYAAIRAQSREPLRLSALPAEHSLEYDARIDLHRERLGRRLPTERVHVGAAVAAHARAEQGAEVLGRNLQRPEHPVASDFSSRE